MSSLCCGEILAPAGSPDALAAAVRCGADAVYLGGQTLNARRNAGNFTDEALYNAVRNCHAHGVNVYLTLNTLVADQELKQAQTMISRACAIGVDALILQDIGLVHLVRACAPGMPIHASTQMSVHTRAGLRLLKSMGFSRAVLAREMSLGEIKAALEEEIELELFVHGALCMSVSGQCYLSAMLGSRSGNRGLCAQPCRLPFSAGSGTGYDLSLKDLSLLEKLPELKKMGIASFKIEGRMKRPEYVAAAVTAVRKSLDGTLTQGDTDALRSVFSRSGFTDGYLTGKIGHAMFGIRQKEDVTAAAPVFKSLAKLYEKERQSRQTDMHLTICKNQPVRLTASSGGISVTVDACIPEAAKTTPLTQERASAQLAKCGGTIFQPRHITCEIAQGLTVSMSVLNGLRRDTLDALYDALSAPDPVAFRPALSGCMPKPAHICPARRLFTIRVGSMNSLPQNLPAYGIDTVILPLTAPPEAFARLALEGITPCVEIPRGLFGQEAQTACLLKAAKENGAAMAFANTLDAVMLAKEAGFSVLGGFGLNLFNSLSLSYVQALGLARTVVSLELTQTQIRHLRSAIPRGIFAYGHAPLMLTRNCPVKNATACSMCGGKGALTDRKHVVFPVECGSASCDVLNSLPIYTADRLDSLPGADFFLLYFTRESPAEIREILVAYQQGAPTASPITRGLLTRGVK